MNKTPQQLDYIIDNDDDTNMNDELMTQKLRMIIYEMIRMNTLYYEQQYCYY